MSPLGRAASAREADSQSAGHDSIAYVAEQLSLFRDERDWARFHTPKNLALSIVIEAGELLEHFQWIDDEEIPEYVSRRRDDVAEELADVTIYVIQLADILGISLSEALRDKLALNAERYPSRVARGSHAKYTELTARRAS